MNDQISPPAEQIAPVRARSGMAADLVNFLPMQELRALLSTAGGELLLAGLFFVATATLVALCVPGVLLPMALGSGALIGAWEASATILLGAVAGSQLFFLLVRRFAGNRLRPRLGDRFEAFQRRFTANGMWYLIGLRLVGAPHLLVAGGSALTTISPHRFALATLIGLLPAITAAAVTGSTL